MKPILSLTTSCCLLLLVATIQAAAAPSSDDHLWYRQPATQWLEALPVGNGNMGAMVFGGLPQERLALNESSFWSGRPHDYNVTNAGDYFPQIRDLVAAGKFSDAEKMANDHFWGSPKAQEAYQPIGDLLLNFGSTNVTDYHRELDLQTGVVTVTYRQGRALIKRETFISWPDRVLVERISADRPGRVALSAQFRGPYLATSTAQPRRLVMDGAWQGPFAASATGMAGLIARTKGKGIAYEAAVDVRLEGGQSAADGATVTITNANAVTLVLALATSFVNYTNISGDPAATCQQILARCADKTYATLRQRHEADFRGLMSRVQLKIGNPDLNQKPTDERLAAVRAGGLDPNLEALTFQFGRYLLASSSRAGGQAANLQGIWDEELLPPWGSKYTLNINAEMNYWPAEVCNLSECTPPLFELTRDLAASGAETARIYYGVGGWVAHHNTDLWRGTAPVDAARYGMWPDGGAWLCQQLWEHYAFTGDTNFLSEYYPVMKGAAQFFLEVMIEDPKHHWLVTPFSMSPEHGYYDASGKLSFLSPSPTMDVGLIRELFPHCIAASQILGLDPDFRARLQTALTRLPPYRLSAAGYVQEWLEDWKPGDQGHNVSANFPFYPGNSLTLRGQPEFAAAYQRWMDDHPPDGGFRLSWGIAMWARLERGDRAGALMREYLKVGPAANLHNAHNNQSDASYGYTAAVAEALVQSHAGEISLLPALPPEWPAGSVTGLRARGAYEVGITWRAGQLVTAQIHSLHGGTIQLRNGPVTRTLTLTPGQTYHWNGR